MKKALGITSAALIALAGLTSCGASDYCTLYKHSWRDLRGMEFSEMKNLDEAQDSVGKLHEAAPSNGLKDSWRDIDNAIDGVRNALGQAGVSFDDFKTAMDTAQSTGSLDGLSKKTATQLTTEISEVRSEHNVRSSLRSIRKYSQRNCTADSDRRKKRSNTNRSDDDDDVQYEDDTGSDRRGSRHR